MKLINTIAALAAGMAFLGSCTIENDIDYPIVEGYFTSFAVDGQLSSNINRNTRSVTVRLPYGTDASALTISSLGLCEGAACADLSEGGRVDLSNPVSVVIRTYQEYIWTISASVVMPSVEGDISVNARATRAEFTTPAADPSLDAVFEWKTSDGSEWTSGSSVSAVDGAYTYTATCLQDATSYTVRLNIGGSTGADTDFTTEEAAQLPNMSFDEWCTESYNNRTCHYPGPSVDEGRIWDSANKGVLTISRTCATTPETGFLAVGGDGKQAARMESMFPNFLGIGRFAAGNLLTGEFIRTTGSGGSLGAQMSWGVPFTSRPTALHGWYAYSPKTIDHDDTGANPELVGQGDQMQILVLLTDWAEPFTVNTAEGIFVDQDNDPAIIAKALLETGESTYDADGNLCYVEFTLEFEYRDEVRKPTYIVLNACASRFGDTFTGAVGSLLYVDEFEFIY